MTLMCALTSQVQVARVSQAFLWQVLVTVGAGGLDTHVSQWLTLFYVLSSPPLVMVGDNSPGVGRGK